MILQQILFPKEDICKETELYYRNPSIQFGDGFLLESHKVISFDTYFNSFSLEKWKKYTFIDNLYLRLHIKGKCNIALYEATLVNESVQTRLLTSRKKDNQEETITILFPETNTLHGICYFVISSDENPCQIISGYYGTEMDADQTNKVRIGIGICTYKREHFILKNLKAIQETILDNPQSELHDNLEIIVSDNGQTLQNFDYTHPKVQIVSNINAGGSGGFARCMIEAIKAKETLNLTHLLLMDDDIVLDPAILLRTYKILLFLKKRHLNKIIGGAMLKLEEPSEQLEFGAKRQQNLSKPALLQNNKDVNLSNFHSVVHNELSNTITPNYNAWWYCCIPFNHITSNNLPLPFFIHFDDIEYGCRLNEEIILFNGIVVWHSFQNKYSPILVYYDTRNRLLTSIIRDPLTSTSRFNLIQYTLFHFIAFTNRYMYIDWKMFVLAIKDLCKGANAFQQINPPQLHESLATIANIEKVKCNGLRMNFLSEKKIKEIYKKMENFSFSQKVLLIFSIINSFIPLGKTSPICINNLCFQSFWGHNHIVWKYSENIEEGVRLKKSLAKAIKALVDMFILQVLIIWKWNSVRKGFRAAVPELTSMEFWEHYLKLKE